MAKLNVSGWIKNVISQKKTIAIPVLTHPGIEKIGKTVKEAVCDGNVHYEAIKYLSDNYPSAAATVIMDLTVEAEAFGSDIIFPENEVPSVNGRLVSNEQEIDSLEVPSLEAGRIPEYLRANILAARNISDKPVLAGCIGPFSLAGRLFDMSEIMVLPYTNEKAARTLLEKCTDLILRYCVALKATGVNGVLMAEPAAGLLSNDDCYKLSSVYVKKIIDAVQDDNFAVILHNCGNNGQCTEAMIKTGAAGYHFGNKIDMVQACRDVPSDCLVMGNLDPVQVFKQQSAAEVKAETLRLLNLTKDFPNFVISSGCDIPPHTPIENIDAFYEAVEEFNR